MADYGQYLQECHFEETEVYRRCREIEEMLLDVNELLKILKELDLKRETRSDEIAG